MKIYITDIRNNPRIIYIDGRRFILPSRKEIEKEVSRASYEALSKLPFIRVREVVEDDPIIEDHPIEEAPKEELKGAVEEVKEEIPVEETPKEVIPEMANAAEVLNESVIVSQEEISEDNKEEKPDYSAMSKKELKAIVEEKGGDPTGMTKANLLSWLNENT